jgi:hypothetical protein
MRHDLFYRLIFTCYSDVGSPDPPSPEGYKMYVLYICGFFAPGKSRDCMTAMDIVERSCASAPPPPRPQPMGKPPFPGATSISRQNREGGRTVFYFISVPT